MEPTFWGPWDWSQFLPDVIVGLLTGLAVGVVILLTQRIADRRRSRDVVVRQWAIVWGRVYNRVQRRGIRLSLDDFTKLGSFPKELDRIGNTYPLALWHSELHDRRLSCLITAVEQVVATRAAAANYERTLRTALDRAKIVDPGVGRIVRAIAMGWYYEDAWTRLEISKKTYMGLMKQADTLDMDLVGSLSSLGLDFQKSHTRMVNDFQELARWVQSQPDGTKLVKSKVYWRRGRATRRRPARSRPPQAKS